MAYSPGLSSDPNAQAFVDEDNVGQFILSLARAGKQVNAVAQPADPLKEEYSGLLARVSDCHQLWLGLRISSHLRLFYQPATFSQLLPQLFFVRIAIDHEKIPYCWRDDTQLALVPVRLR